jgi:hypothetical protein
MSCRAGADRMYAERLLVALLLNEEMETGSELSQNALDVRIGGNQLPVNSTFSAGASLFFFAGIEF